MHCYSQPASLAIQLRVVLRSADLGGPLVVPADRVRPGYPDELFADLVTITRMGEGASVLEVGCGTGQATRSLAALGCSVTAVEPGAGMAALARRRIATFRNVDVETSTFEEWDDRGRRFDGRLGHALGRGGSGFDDAPGSGTVIGQADGSRWRSACGHVAGAAGEVVTSEAHKAVVRRLVDEVMNRGQLEILDELYLSSAMADAARAWIRPFRNAFPDVHMRVVDLVAESDKVAARFTCSATQRGPWQGRAGTGQRFERVAAVYFFRFRDGKIVSAWGWRTTSPGCGNSATWPTPATADRVGRDFVRRSDGRHTLQVARIRLRPSARGASVVVAESADPGEEALWRIGPGRRPAVIRGRRGGQAGPRLARCPAAPRAADRLINWASRSRPRHAPC